MQRSKSGFPVHRLQLDLEIKDLISIHYFQYPNTFLFPGEKHDFWEFLYVDKGSVIVTAGNNTHTLKQGDIIFHKPNEFHSVSCIDTSSPNLVVISFDCESSSMNYLKNKKISVPLKSKAILNDLLCEAKNAFCSDFSNPYFNMLIRNVEQQFGCEQLFKNHLEIFLLLLIRNLKTTPIKEKKGKKTRYKNTEFKREQLKTVIDYMEHHIGEHINLEALSKVNNMSKTALQNLFKEKTGSSVIEYYNQLKILSAQKMIREGKLNFSEIADRLGYSSQQYFSRQFSLIAGMSPRDYSFSIQLILLSTEK